MKNIKKKLKPLLSSLRERKRYLAFEIVSDEQIDDFTAVSGEIMDSALDFLGELGCAEAGIMILDEKWNEKLQRGLIKVNRRYVDKLKVSLALMDSVQDKKAMVRTIGISGIMKKAEKRYLAA